MIIITTTPIYVVDGKETVCNEYGAIRQSVDDDLPSDIIGECVTEAVSSLHRHGKDVLAESLSFVVKFRAGNV